MSNMNVHTSKFPAYLSRIRGQQFNGTNTELSPFFNLYCNTVMEEIVG